MCWGLKAPPGVCRCELPCVSEARLVKMLNSCLRFILGHSCAGCPQWGEAKPRDPPLPQGLSYILSILSSALTGAPAWHWGTADAEPERGRPRDASPPPQELFKRVVPYHCLGSIWSQRDKKGKEHLAPTVRATVTQFNNVANCVITTCLKGRHATARDRARVVEHWIEVARVGPRGACLCPLPGSRLVQAPAETPPLPCQGLTGLGSHTPLPWRSLPPRAPPSALLRSASTECCCPGTLGVCLIAGGSQLRAAAAGAGGGLLPTSRPVLSPPRNAESSRTFPPSTPSSLPCRATRSTG